MNTNQIWIGGRNKAARIKTDYPKSIVDRCTEDSQATDTIERQSRWETFRIQNDPGLTHRIADGIEVLSNTPVVSYIQPFILQGGWFQQSFYNGI